MKKEKVLNLEEETNPVAKNSISEKSQSRKNVKDNNDKKVTDTKKVSSKNKSVSNEVQKDKPVQNAVKKALESRKNSKIKKQSVPIRLKTQNKYKKIIPDYHLSSKLFFNEESFESDKPFYIKFKNKIKNIFSSKKKKENEDAPIVDEFVERYETDFNQGLNKEQVENRIKDNLTNNSKVRSSKSYWSIFAKNIFTFFNMLWLIIAIALFAVGSYSDLIFVFVIIANTAIAIIQEIRAKIAVEKLSIVTTPMIKTVRDGAIEMIPADQLVLDDVIILSNGSQVPADCKILNGNVEVNESLLTGESNAIEKNAGGQLLSGSFLVSGECHARVEKIGKDNYISQMAKKAKEFKTPQSNLFKDLNRLIKYIGIALVPIGVLTFLKEYAVAGSTIKDQVTNTSGALTSMIPAGMFLLVTISLAIGVVKLSRKKTLVRDLYSIEMLARTNVLCLDKTGTITDGTMKVVDYATYTKRRRNSVIKALSNVLCAQKTVNATSNALIQEFGRDDSTGAMNIAEFTSDRKFSITQLNNRKIYFLGAVTKIGCPVDQLQQEFINDALNKGLRVIAFAEQEDGQFDKNMTGKNATLLSLIVIEEHIREDAVETIQWFKDNGVDIKIISGDDPATVSKIAMRVGVDHSDKYVSLESFSLKEVEQMADQFTVFGRVTPEQKYTIVKALKNKGKVVAMTGDGVNDTLALKEADCSIAMADGSEVARSISKLVLLESNFSSLPAVVKEGRQVVNNVQNSSSLFLMKTFFAIMLTVITLFVQLPYPFKPSMMLLLEFFVIGVPSFLLTFEPNNKPIKGNFIPQVMKRSLPRALLMLINVLIVMILYHSQSAEILSTDDYKTLVVLILTYSGWLNLSTLCFPPTLLKGVTLGVSFVGITLSIIAMPKLFSITSSSFAVLVTFFSIILVSIITLVLIKLNTRKLDRLRDKIIKLLQKQQ